MRKEMYDYNNSERERNYRRSFRRKMRKVVCVTTASAAVLTSIPFVSYTDSYARVQTLATGQEQAAVTIPMDNAVTYDLQDAALRKEIEVVDLLGEKYKAKVIEINITEDGNYIIKGSNEVNDAYMDTHITVADGVTANVIFDGAVIYNDDIYYDKVGGCGTASRSGAFPVMDIAGTANIYVKSDSVLYSQKDNNAAMISLAGKLVFKDSGQDAELTIARVTDPESEDNLYLSRDPIVSGLLTKEMETTGEVLVEGGTLSVQGVMEGLKSFAMTGGNININSSVWYASVIAADNVCISGGTLTHKKNAEWATTYLFAANRFIVTGGKIVDDPDNQRNWGGLIERGGDGTLIVGGTIQSTSLDSLMDAYGNCLYSYSLTGLPANAQVSEINGQTVSDMKADETGTLSVLLPKSNAGIVLNDGTSYVYGYDTSGDTFRLLSQGKNNTDMCEITLTKPNGQSALLSLPKGFVLADYYNDFGKQYTYSTDGTDTVGNIALSADEEFTLKERKCTVTIDGTAHEMEYGEALPATGVLYRDDDASSGSAGSAYCPGDVVTGDMNIVSSLSLVERDGVTYAQIKSNGDVEELDYLRDRLGNRAKYLNVSLETDLDYTDEDLSSAYGAYSILNDEDGYAGILDGNGHTIRNMGKMRYGWVCERLYGTVRNLHFEGVTGFEPYYDTDRIGVICASNFGTIENCSVKSAGINTVKEDDTSDDWSKSMVERAAFAGANFGTIQDSYAYDCTITGEGERLPIAKNYGSGVIQNCYFEADKESGKIEKTEEQFASGEICYLLNHGVTDGSQYWYQNLGSDGQSDAAPVPKTGTSHKTVYAGYEEDSCQATYTNDVVKPVHTLNYTAEGAVLKGVCTSDASHTITVTLSASDAGYDGTEHVACLTWECSDTWNNAEVPEYEIVYTRDGEVTTDLTSPGTIKASVTAGGKTAYIVYTITRQPEQSAAPGTTETPGTTTEPGTTETPGTATEPGTSETPKATELPGTSEVPKVTEVPGTSEAPKVTEVPGTTETPDATKSPASVGKTIKDAEGDSYRVVKAEKSKTPEVAFYKTGSPKCETATVPKTVSLKGVTYKVTAIAAKAYANCKNLKEVTIGKNIKKIGKKAFYNCRNLKKVTIKTTVLKANNVGAKAFTGIHKKAVVTVPEKKKKVYKKWLKKRGIVGKRTIKTED